MRKGSGFLATVLFLFASEAVLALDLLESLEAEGQSVVLDEGSMAQHQPGAIVDQSLLIPTGSECQTVSQIGKELVQGLSWRDFEDALRRNHCSTSLFYKKISQYDRKQVYDAYLLNPDLMLLRKMILSKMP